MTGRAEHRLLGRNRDFTLLWVGQAVAALGSGATLVVYPLLVLALGGSAAEAGVVVAVGTAAQLLTGLPAGVVADRLDKPRLMVSCEAVRALTVAVLAWAIMGGWAGLGLIAAVAAVNGVCAAVFGAVEAPAVRQLVPPPLLPTALARNEARSAAAMLVGPPLGGALFALAPALPFVVNALTFLISCGCVLFLRTPLPSQLETRRPVGRDLWQGITWIWRHRFLRVTLVLISSLNLVSNALFLAVVVDSDRRGDAAPATGLLLTMAAVGGLAGALAAPALVRRLSVRTILVLNRVIWAAGIASLVWLDSSYAVGLVMGLMFFIGPTGSTAVTSRQMQVTPDGLQGRASSARGFVAGLGSPVGTVVAGLLLAQIGRVGALACLAMVMVATAMLAAGSAGVRADGAGRATDEPSTRRCDAPA